MVHRSLFRDSGGENPGVTIPTPFPYLGYRPHHGTDLRPLRWSPDDETPPRKGVGTGLWRPQVRSWKVRMNRT